MFVAPRLLVASLASTLTGCALLVVGQSSGVCMPATYVAVVLVAHALSTRTLPVVGAVGLATALIAAEPLLHASHAPSALSAGLGLAVVWGTGAWLVYERQRSGPKLPYAELYAEIVETSHTPLIVLSPELKLMSVNQTFRSMFALGGEASDPLVGKALREVDSGRWDHETLLRKLRGLATGEDGRLALEHLLEQELPKLGNRILLLKARHLSHLDEKTCLLVTLDDVTERHKSLRDLKKSHSTLRRTTAKLEETEKQLAQAARLEAIGRLAGGVAHDFNNMLSAVIGFSHLAKVALPENHPIQRYLDGIGEAGEQSAALTRKLLAYGRRSVLSPKVLDLNEILSSASTLLAPLLGEDLQLEISPGSPLGQVFLDPLQTEQAIVNLAVNARDAMPTGGTLRLSTANVTLTEQRARALGPEVKAGNYVVLRVSDTGTGMTPETLSHVFEPFYTTKDAAHGTGLGLATTHGFVNQSGGTIRAESTLGKGSVFALYFPQVELPVSASAPAPSGASWGRRGSETILVVEDAAVVRGVFYEALGSHGYQVLLAADAAEGLALAEDYPGTIDLIITDVVMPKMSGTEFIAALPVKRLGVPVLYTSGYTETRILSHGLDGSQVMFLPKPIRIDDLLSLVREIIDGSLTPSR